MSKCQDSGQIATQPVTSQCGHLTALCGGCGKTVFVVIDTSEIPHYADH